MLSTSGQGVSIWYNHWLVLPFTTIIIMMRGGCVHHNNRIIVSCYTISHWFGNVLWQGSPIDNTHLSPLVKESNRFHRTTTTTTATSCHATTPFPAKTIEAPSLSLALHHDHHYEHHHYHHHPLQGPTLSMHLSCLFYARQSFSGPGGNSVLKPSMA